MRFSLTIPYYSRIKDTVTNFMIVFLYCSTYQLPPVSLSLSLMQHLDQHIFSDISLLAAYLQIDVLRFFFCFDSATEGRVLISGLDAGVWSVDHKPPCWCCSNDLRDCPMPLTHPFLLQMKSHLSMKSNSFGAPNHQQCLPQLAQF